MKFSEIIKDLRAESGLSQMELSKRINISAAAIGFLELGKHEPNSATIVAYSKYFNVSADFLLGLEGDDFNVHSPTIVPLSDEYTKEERKFIENLRKLTPGMRDILRSTLNAMLDDSNEGVKV